MIFMPARRADSRTLEMGSTTFWMGAMSTPARSNIPPLLPKSFCMSTTVTAVRAVSMVIGSGEASMIACRPALNSVMTLPPFTLLPYNDALLVEATLHQEERNLIAESRSSPGLEFKPTLGPPRLWADDGQLRANHPDNSHVRFPPQEPDLPRP